MASDREQVNQIKQSHVRINVPESTKIRSIDEAFPLSGTRNQTKNAQRYEFDPETEKIIMIQDELKESDALRRVTIDSEVF